MYHLVAGSPCHGHQPLPCVRLCGKFGQTYHRDHFGKKKCTCPLGPLDIELPVPQSVPFRNVTSPKSVD